MDSNLEISYTYKHEKKFIGARSWSTQSSALQQSEQTGGKIFAQGRKTTVAIRGLSRLVTM